MQKVSFGPVWDHIQKVREEQGFEPAIKLANKYLVKDPESIEAYLQLMDMYYLMGELEKAEKPVDFLLKKNIWNEYIKKDVLHYVKALLLAEKTQWLEAKKYIKKALEVEPENIEYKRVLAMVEFWSWNKHKGYELLKEIIQENEMVDAEMLLNAVTMAAELGYYDEARLFTQMYLENQKKITYFTKPKSFYDKQFTNFKIALLPIEENKWQDWKFTTENW